MQILAATFLFLLLFLTYIKHFHQFFINFLLQNIIKIYYLPSPLCDISHTGYTKFLPTDKTVP